MHNRINQVNAAALGRLARKALVLAALSCSVNAFAQTFIGLSVGQSRSDIDCVGAITCDKNGTAYKIFGGYMFTPNLGMEASFYDRGNVRQTTVDPELGAASAKWSGRSYGLYGIAAAPFDSGSIFAKVGVLRSDLKREISGSNSASVSSTNTDFAWGLGAGYKYSNNAAARIEFERIRTEFGGSKLDVDLVTLGFLFRF